MAVVPIEQGQESFCAERTRQAGEPLFGTATEVRIWFLLEYRQLWRAKAVTNNDLPAGVQKFLAQQLVSVPQSRLLFIKQHKPVQSELRFFVVITDEISPKIYEFILNSYQDLLQLDIPGIVGGGNVYGRFERERPLFLVCTNGTRDKCCAKFGVPLYTALSGMEGENVWQSSHIGGHRYAPTVLFLPHSVVYGLMTPEAAGPAVDAALKAEIFDLDRFRGRTYYVPHVQAADYFLRRKLGLTELSGVELVSTEPVAKDCWLVAFRVATGEIHQFRILQQMTGEPQLVSCNSPKMKPVPRFRLLGL